MKLNSNKEFKSLLEDLRIKYYKKAIEGKAETIDYINALKSIKVSLEKDLEIATNEFAKEKGL